MKTKYWQIIRGICIITVILIHCPSALNLQLSSSGFLSWLFIRSIINFPVPVFFFISGYFAATSLSHDKNLPEYYINRIGERLLLPYTIYSVIYLACIVVIKNNTLSISEILMRYISGRTATPFYYIIVLIQLVLVSPLLIKSNQYNKKIINRLVYALPIIMLVVIYYFAITKAYIPWSLDTALFLWVGFYYLGIQVRQNNRKATGLISQLGRPAIVMLAFIINISESYVLLNHNVVSSLAVSQNRIGGFIYATAIIGIIYNNRNAEIGGGIGKTLRIIGDHSYGIFWIHYLFIQISEIVITKIYPYAQWPLKYITAFSFGLILSLMVIVVCNRIFKGSIGVRFLKAIGFR